MNKIIHRTIAVMLALALALGVFISAQAESKPAALLSGDIVNLAYFYKPPSNSDAATVAHTYDTVILTGGDESFRAQLTSNGFAATVMQYYGALGIQDPGDCSSTPRHNQVAYNASDFCSISQDHPDWFLLDTSGQRVKASPTSDIYRMDPGNAGWRAFFVQRVLDYQASNGWSGLFLDNVEASLSDLQGYGYSLAKYPDDASYHAAVKGFLQYLHDNYSQPYNRPLFGNIIARRDEAGWLDYMQVLDGAMQERWAVAWDLAQYVTESKWISDLVLAEKTQNLGKHIIAVAPGNQGDTNRENFAFASFLLVSNGKAAFRYSGEKTYNEVWTYSNFQVNLGTPLGARYQSGSLWRRDFANGYVTVDPVNHTATISIGSPTPTATTVPPTKTPIPPTATQPPTSTPTKTPVPPTATQPPTSTPTKIVPTPTNVPATSTAAPAVPNEKTYDDKDRLFVYSSGWQNTDSGQAYNGSYHETTRSGATVTFPFTGQSFSIIYKGNVAFSNVRVYVDGALIGTINEYALTSTYGMRWNSPTQFVLGKHTLKLIFKPAGTTTTSRASLDAVIIR